MEYPDLHTFPEGHPPSPYNSPALVVKIGDGSLPRGLELRVVGWLEKPGFLTGKVIDECLDALVVAHSEGKIFSDGHRGIHDCTLCGRGRPKIRWRGQTLDLLGHGHYLIQMKDSVYGPRIVVTLHSRPQILPATRIR